MNNPYEKGRRAKELVGVYKNPYRQGTAEYDDWRLGFDHGIQQPLEDIELEEDTFFDNIEPLKVINHG